VALPLMLVIGALIRLRMGPGVLYTQERVGRDGSTFRIVKFRTMDTDRRSNDLGFVGSDRRVVHKTRDDPRHTGLGSLLRRTSLDELPQLWNVLRGDMVLVGPRPELTTVVHKHGLVEHPRHRLKPGITGLWQVSEHRHELLHETMDIDLDYIEELSLMTDVRILVRTLVMPFGGTGS
jgi:lipopolysaccharide/colanic/teichoic acid biosynthesis glycosyltransferase